MPTDYTEKMEALRSLHERLQAKETDIPELAYKAAGVKSKARIKDVEKEISATKKKIGSQIRREVEREALEMEEKEAELMGLTLEEYRERIDAAGKKGSLKQDATYGKDRAGKQYDIERALVAERAKKELRLSADVEYDD